MQKYFNTILDQKGDPISTASVTVQTSAGATATIYSDNSGTTTGNPLSTDENGYFEFYAPNGIYTIVATKTGKNTVTIEGVLLDDPTVATIAALKAAGLPTTANARITVLGYTSAGDGGGGDFYWVTGDQSANVTADTQSGIWVAPTSASTGASGAWKRLYDGDIDPRWYGAKFDGVTNDTTAIQAALNVGERVVCPDGTCLANLTLSSHMRLYGKGKHKTIIKPYSTLAHTITTKLTEHVVRIELGDMTVYGVQGSTTYDAINLEAPQVAAQISWLDQVHTRNLMTYYGRYGLRVRGYSNTTNYGFVQNWTHTGSLDTFESTSEGVRIEGDIYESSVDKIFVYDGCATSKVGLYIGIGSEALGYPQRLFIGNVTIGGADMLAGSNGTAISIAHAAGVTVASSNLEINTGDATNKFLTIDGSLNRDIRFLNANFQNSVAITNAISVVKGKGIQIAGRIWGTATVTNGVNASSVANGDVVGLDIKNLTFHTNVTNPALGTASVNELDASGGGSNVVVNDLVNPIYVGEDSTQIESLAGVPHGAIITVWGIGGTATSNYIKKNGIFQIDKDWMPHKSKDAQTYIQFICYNIAGTMYFREVSRSGGEELSVSADNGNAAKTLTAGTDETTQLWNTAITADRAVTLSTTNAYNGAKFRIVRGAGATGAFNLNVGTGPLKALAAASTWCDVEYNGSAWMLTAYGAL